LSGRLQVAVKAMREKKWRVRDLWQILTSYHERKKDMQPGMDVLHLIDPTVPLLPVATPGNTNSSNFLSECSIQ